MNIAFKSIAVGLFTVAAILGVVFAVGLPLDFIM